MVVQGVLAGVFGQGGSVDRWLDTLRRRRAGEPPRRIFVAALALAGIASLWNASRLSGSLELFVVCALAWLVLAAVWGGLVVSALVRRQGRARLRAAWRRWLVVPAAVVVVAALLRTDAPLRARFGVSAEALESTAVAAAEGRDPELGWRGLYRVAAAWPAPGGGAMLRVDGAAGGVFTVDGGLAYFPNGNPVAPAETAGARFEHLSGPWYLWWVRW